MKKIIKVTFTIIASLIGAGFASGQEINTFFYAYGIKGIPGLIICSLLLISVIYKTLNIIKKERIQNYKEFLKIIVGKRFKLKYINFSSVINLIVNIFLMITFFIMIAGFGAYFSQELGINRYVGSGILSMVCFITFMTNDSGVVKISNILVPIIISFIVIIGIINLNSIELKETVLNLEKTNSNGWLINSILYCSYNSILLIPMLILLKKYIKGNNSIIISLMSGIIIFILAISIFFLLTRIQIDINKLEMPVLYIIRHQFSEFRNIYAFIILTSIYTTAISIGVSFLENFSYNKNIYKFMAVFICMMGFIVSGFGFSNLVAFIYPIFGYLGLIQIGIILSNHANGDGGKWLDRQSRQWGRRKMA